jgi:thiol-disulfide isomerase/thioredoxin
MSDPRIRRLFALGLVLIGLGLVVSVAIVLYLQNRPAEVGFPRVGSQLANFRLLDLQGSQVSLADYSGQTILINAWATWCPPCRDEMPMLVDYAKRHPNDLTILAIDAGEARAEVSAFVQQYGMTFPVLLDPDSRYLDSILVNNLPTTILVGPDGMVRAFHVGGMDEAIFTSEILAKIPR